MCRRSTPRVPEEAQCLSGSSSQVKQLCTRNFSQCCLAHWSRQEHKPDPLKYRVKTTSKGFNTGLILRPGFSGGCQPLPGRWWIVFAKSGPPEVWIENLKFSLSHLSPQLAFSQGAQGDCPTEHSAPDVTIYWWSMNMKNMITLLSKMSITAPLHWQQTLHCISSISAVGSPSPPQSLQGTTETDKIKIYLSLIESSTCLVWCQGVDPVQLAVADQLLGNCSQGGDYQDCWPY